MVHLLANFFNNLKSNITNNTILIKVAKAIKIPAGGIYYK